MQESQWDRLSENYHEEIMSPFFGKVKNPLYKELDKVKNKKNKSVAEFGCGFFYLGKLLSDKFKNVHASDFCEGMVSAAAQRSRHLKNVTIKKEDLRKLPHRNKFDITISVNSIIMPSYKDILTAFKNIYRSLKDKGTFLAILPSMEAVLYHGMLLYVDEMKKKDEKKAYTAALRKFDIGNYDLFRGTYDDGDKQKFFYSHEILYFLEKAGFKHIKFDKVIYPWGSEIHDYEDFPKEKPIWDWFVKAKKS